MLTSWENQLKISLRNLKSVQAFYDKNSNDMTLKELKLEYERIGFIFVQCVYNDPEIDLNKFKMELK